MASNDSSLSYLAIFLASVIPSLVRWTPMFGVGVIEVQNVVIGLTVADDSEFQTERIITFLIVVDWIVVGGLIAKSLRAFN